MRASRQHKKQAQLQRRAPIRALCCSSCRLSVSSSSEEVESSSTSDRNRYPSISSLAHAMVQERLDQMIRERQEEDAARVVHVDRRRRKNKVVYDDRAQATGTKFVVMVAMEKCSYDPREDFRESIAEMIMAKRIEEPKDLRSLLNYYVSMNSEDYHGIILEVFHEVCSDLFLCKCH
ncbi:putative transcription factor OFP family [Rosa chinensis]|uniref:Transcription repressor n=1 Tax=Rosa chinensis TaxID=74649 RepID=A0A2P6Q2C9_ROSCH|nr:probable transcription repressor OFP9 [Rosa chinensis]PRQ28335.1 putative transcription factor OFP family [Rosa chinensis]